MRLKNDTNNFAASFNITPPYQMLVLHSKMLIYPRELYQRGVQRKRVEMIAADFNEYVANEPKVSFRNGKYYVVDGQHTIEGRILRNGGKDLPTLCKVYTGLTMEQEALFFAEQNGHSAPLTAGIKLRAKVVGGDAPSKAFLAATNRVGLAFNYDSLQLSDYRISCVGTALKLYNQMGEKIYCECPNSRSSRRRSLKLHSVSGKIALPTQRKKPNTMFLFVPVDRHCFPITFTAATVVQGSP